MAQHITQVTETELETVASSEYSDLDMTRKRVEEELTSMKEVVVRQIQAATIWQPNIFTTVKGVSKGWITN